MKRGQLKLSFGMIFSIILIIAFLVFAFYAIRFFLGVNDTAKVGTFIENFQDDVDSIWKGQFGEQPQSYALPQSIEKVCIKNWAYENLVFVPADAVEIPPVNISHINMEKTTARENRNAGDPENSFCVENTDGKIRLLLKKEFGETSVTLLRE